MSDEMFHQKLTQDQLEELSRLWQEYSRYGLKPEDQDPIARARNFCEYVSLGEDYPEYGFPEISAFFRTLEKGLTP